MAEYKGEISGIGVSAARTNEITADDVAVLRNFIVRWESGVISGLQEDTEKRTDTSLIITRGLMFAYGYFGFFPRSFAFYFNKTAATQYHFIYAEIDRSVIPNTAILKVKNNQGGSQIKPTTFRQDVLSTIKTGVFQLPLYRVTLTSEGISQVQDLRDYKEFIKQVKYAPYTKGILQTIAYGAKIDGQVAITDNSDIPATTKFVHDACRAYIDE